MALRLSLLGTPLISVDSRQVEFDTRKAVALLAYLAVTGQPQGRDTLAALLWPDFGADHARSALRRTLSTARKGLSDRWLVAGRHAIHLEPEGVELDVDRFRFLIARPETGALDEALGLYRGEFMAGFGLRDSIEFEEWQLAQADVLRRDFAQGLERLSRALLAGGDSRRAIELAHRWLGLDPLSEPAHRWLMELYARSGDRAAAVRQYRDCVRVLDEELGVPPLRDTTELYEAITADSLLPLRGEIPPRPAAPSPGLPQPPAPAVNTYPLVGRGAEIKALTRAYDEVARAHDGGVIVIEGEPGIGKTRLTQELVALATQRGAQTVSVRCYEGEQRLAYASWMEALRQAIEILPPDLPERVPPQLLADAALLAPELRARSPDLPSPLEGPGAQARLFEAVAQIMSAALSREAPGLLVLDDLQWADGASLDLLAYLSRRLSGRRLCVVVCRRPEPVHDGGQVDHLFAELTDRGTVALRPQRLLPTDIGQLLAAVGVVPSLVDRLVAETEGVPYFVVEYLAALTGPDPQTVDSVSVPRGVRSLLQSRIGSVDPTARQLLSAAAVIGRSFDADLARETSGRDEDETVNALEELTRGGLIREAASGNRLHFDFTHDQLRQLVYEETSLPRRQLLHRRAAEALARRVRQRRSDITVALVARHYQAAREDHAAATWYRLAGDASRRVHANDEALGQYRAALALGTDDPVSLHEAIGDLETLAGDYEAALANYEKAAASASADRLASLEHRLGAVHQRRGAWHLAESHFERALELGPDDDAGTRARIVADQSLNAYRQGNRVRAMDRARRAMDLAERGRDLVALAQVHNLLGILESGRQRRGPAFRHLTESLRLAEQLPNPSARIAALNNLAHLERWAGNTARAIELTRSALKVCVKQGDRHREAALHNNLADLLHRTGQHEEAMDELKRAVSIFGEIGHATQPEQLQPEIWKLVEW